MRTHEKIVDTLIEAGVTTAFTLPGLGITWSLGAFHDRRDELRVVLARSEQIASIMAQTYGRLTGRPGVFLAMGPFAATTGGFGILEAHFAGSPMLILTDTADYDGYGQYGVYQTMTGDYGGADVQSALRGMTKYCTYATEPQDVIYGLQLAYKHASLPRQGPAAVIMKSGLVRREFPEQPSPALYPAAGYQAYTPARPDPEAVAKLGAWIAEAERPVFVLGNGAHGPGVGAAAMAHAQAAGIAIATSYNGKGVVHERADVSVGMLGTWGHRTANAMLAAADLVVMLGASMGPDYTRFRDPTLVRPGDQRLVQVDVDPRNAGWVYPVDLPITGDVADVLAGLVLEPVEAARRDARLAFIADLKRRTGYDEVVSLPARPGTLHFTDVVAALQAFLTADDLLALDAGTNRIWATHALRIEHPGQLLVAGGIGGMGWGAPAAAAAKLVHPDKRVTCLTGDGGFAMTVAVLATCVQEDLPIVVVVANNAGLGMVRDNLREKRYAVDFSPIDFAQVARGMGADGVRVERAADLPNALREAHASGRTWVIDVAIDEAASHHPATDG